MDSLPQSVHTHKRVVSHWEDGERGAGKARWGGGGIIIDVIHKNV